MKEAFHHLKFPQPQIQRVLRSGKKKRIKCDVIHNISFGYNNIKVPVASAEDKRGKFHICPLRFLIILRETSPQIFEIALSSPLEHHHLGVYLCPLYRKKIVEDINVRSFKLSLKNINAPNYHIQVFKRSFKQVNAPSKLKLLHIFHIYMRV